MHADIFLREFGQLARGPGGVQKLRDMVLQLAVRGKLVGQVTSDGDAGAILAEIKREADSSIKKRWEKYEAVDALFATPTNWIWTSIGRMSRDWGQKIPDRPFQYVDVGGIDNLKGSISADIEPTHPEDAPSRARKLVAQGTVIYSTVRPYLKNIAVVDRQFTHEPIASTAFAIVHPLAGILPEYVFYYLRSPDFVSYVEGQMKGAAYPAINDGKFFAAPITLPPLAEQKRIVAKVVELMALCDELEARHREETGLKRATAASALHLLTGAKTPEETADRWSLLAAGFGDLFDDLETFKELRGAILDVQIFGLDRSKADGANSELRPLKDFAVSITDGDHQAPPKSESGIPFLVISNVVRGSVDIAGATRFVPLEYFEALKDEKKPNVGDLLYTVTGSIGVPVIVDTEADFCFQRHIAIIKPNQHCDVRYVRYALQSDRAKQQALQVATGTAQKTIPLSGLRNLLIPYRGLEDQRCVVAKVDELMELCDRLEEQVREGERLNAELMASLVHALTETDPDDDGGAVKPTSFDEGGHAIAAPQPENDSAGQSTEKKLADASPPHEPQDQTKPQRASIVDSKFQEAVLVGAIISEFFKAGGEPIGNFRLQKAVYFARRHNGEHVGEMEYLRKAAGPYNPSMKYSGGIAIAKQKNWLREAKGRFGFGHMPGASASEMDDWIEQFGFGEAAKWVADRFRFKKNEDWELLATVDYAIEHLKSLGIEPSAVQILQYIQADDEWRPKIEKLRLTETSIEAAMVEVKASFGTDASERAQ